MKCFTRGVRSVFVVVTIVSLTIGVNFVLILQASKTEVDIKNRKATVLECSRYILGDNIRKRSKLISTQANDIVNQGKLLNDSKVEVRHVAFLKIHKCASSTVQNIFLRFGYRRNLTFLFGRPTKEQPYENVISFTGTLSDNNTLPPPQNKTFDILCCHVFYNQTAFQKYMPADSVYIGIIRDPFEQFLSVLKYFKPKPIIVGSNGTNDPIMDFLRHPKKYKMIWITNNMMSKEFGFPDDLFNNYEKAKILSYLKKLESEFSLIMVVGYFDESLLLLKRLLNWRIKDILFQRLRISTKKNLYINPQLRQRYYSIEKLDTALYQFFFRRLWRQIKAAGNDFFDELLFFKRIQKNVDRFCSKEFKNGSPLVIPESRWEGGFNVTKEDCFLLSWGEVYFLRHLRKKQYGSDPLSSN